jgi:alpha-glucosidase (family GH31 glycosyl hydrolase)
MVPYLYSLHEVAHRTGVPLLRSFPLQEPEEPTAYRIDDQYFVGDDLMVAPLFNDEGDRKVYLPRGLWYDFFGDVPPVPGGRDVERKAVPLDRLPVYVRAGAVIPLGPAMQHTGEKPVDPLSVHVYSFSAAEAAESEHTSAFSLYEDDGISTDYEKGKFQRTQLRFRQTGDAVRFEVETESGDGRYLSVPERAYRLHFRGFLGTVKAVRVDGKEIPQAGVPESARRASWSIDEASGTIVVSIPRAATRPFAVEFATGPASVCAGNC